MNKTALITGVTGQDGSYLAEFLLQKGYTVHGIIQAGPGAGVQGPGSAGACCSGCSARGDCPGCKAGDVIVRVDPRYFRPTEVHSLLGDPARAKQKLGWEPVTSVQELIQEMVDHDLDQARRHAVLRRNGFQVQVSKE